LKQECPRLLEPCRNRFNWPFPRKGIETLSENRWKLLKNLGFNWPFPRKGIETILHPLARYVHLCFNWPFPRKGIETFSGILIVRFME